MMGGLLIGTMVPYYWSLGQELEFQGSSGERRSQVCLYGCALEVSENTFCWPRYSLSDVGQNVR